MPTTVFPDIQQAVIQVAPDGAGKRIANYAVQMYVDGQDGNGPLLQTVYFQAVNVTQLDECGNPLGRDDAIDYEWKRQMLDEMRAIRIGIEHLLEQGRPSFDPSVSSLIEESRLQRVDSCGRAADILEQEN